MKTKIKTTKSKATKTKTAINLHLDNDILGRLDEKADERGVSRTALINIFLFDKLQILDEAIFDPVTCPLEELERAINFTEDFGRKRFFEGVYHYRVFIRAATNGEIE